MLNASYSSCVAACHECITACEAWLDALPADDENASVQHCADLCRSSIRLCRLVIEELKLRSAFSLQVCALGTVICRACADECATIGSGSNDCAAACLRAAEECHAIATMSQSHATV